MKHVCHACIKDTFLSDEVKAKAISRTVQLLSRNAGVSKPRYSGRTFP